MNAVTRQSSSMASNLAGSSNAMKRCESSVGEDSVSTRDASHQSFSGAYADRSFSTIDAPTFQAAPDVRVGERGVGGSRCVRQR